MVQGIANHAIVAGSASTSDSPRSLKKAKLATSASFPRLGTTRTSGPTLTTVALLSIGVRLRQAQTAIRASFCAAVSFAAAVQVVALPPRARL
jgi:hypothetical protein